MLATSRVRQLQADLLSSVLVHFCARLTTVLIIFLCRQHRQLQSAAPMLNLSIASGREMELVELHIPVFNLRPSAIRQYKGMHSFRTALAETQSNHRPDKDQ
jgi:hypothetical protein